MSDTEQAGATATQEGTPERSQEPAQPPTTTSGYPVGQNPEQAAREAHTRLTAALDELADNVAAINSEVLQSLEQARGVKEAIAQLKGGS